MPSPTKLSIQLGLVFSLLPYLVLVSACTHTVPPHAPEASTIPPPEVTLSPKPSEGVPAPGAALPAAKPVESALAVTLTADLTPLQDAARTAVPESFDEAGHPLRSDFRWNFKQVREPKVSLHQGQLAIHAEYQGDIAVRSSAARACHLDPIYPVLDWNARLSVSQDGETLVIRPDSPELLIGLKPESDAKCNMFTVPLKEQLIEVLNRNEVKEQITRAIIQAGVRIPMHSVWEQLHGPYVAPITSLNTRLCIYPDPAELTMGPLEGDLQQAVLRSSAQVYAMAALEHSCHQPLIDPEKLTMGVPASPSGRSFMMTTMLPVPYELVSQRLQETLSRAEVFLPDDGSGEKRLIIEKVSAADAGGKMVIMVQTSGYVKGPIYFWGRPQLAEGAFVTVPDLELDTGTRKMLDAEKAGLWKRVDMALTDKVRRAARIDLADEIATVRKAIAKPHQTEDLVLRIGVGQVRPQQVYSTAQGLITDVAIEGAAQAEGHVKIDSGRQRARAPEMQPTKAPNKEEATLPESRSGLVVGEVLQIEGSAYVVREGSGTDVRLSVDQDTRMETTPKPGDQVVAQIAEDGRTRSIRNASAGSPDANPRR